MLKELGISSVMLGITLEQLLRSPGQIKVLRVLWRAGTPLTGRQVQKIAGLANLAAMQALKKLTALGVVSCREAGRAYQYELKRSHWAVTNLVAPLFENENKGLDYLRELVSRKLEGRCLSAYLYGSVVSHPEGPVGDVDLFILVREEEDRHALENGALLELSDQISRTFGLLLEPNVITQNELSRKSAGKLVLNIMENGHKVWGRDLKKFLS